MRGFVYFKSTSGAYAAAGRAAAFARSRQHDTVGGMGCRFLTRPIKLAAQSLGLWLAMIALAGQMALGAVVPDGPMQRPDEGLTPFTLVICHAGAPQNGNPAPQHGRSDCTLCPLCFAISHASAVLLPAALYAVDRPAVVIDADAAPPARTPPSRSATIPYATGPPSRA